MKSYFIYILCEIKWVNVIKSVQGLIQNKIKKYLSAVTGKRN